MMCVGKTLLIIADGAEPSLLYPCMDKGLMPVAAAMLAGGVQGRLHSLAPFQAQMLNAAALSGHSADRHGVRRPGQEPCVPMLWELAEEARLRCLIVSDQTLPGIERGKGILVGPEFFEGKGICRPAGLAEELAPMLINADTLDSAVLRLLCPALHPATALRDPLARLLANTVAGFYNVLNVGVSLLETEDWDLAIVHSSFMARMLQSFGHLSGAAKTRYEGLLENACRLLDLCLGQILGAAGADCRRFLVSLRGARLLWPGFLAEYPFVMPGAGLFIASGPGIRKGLRIGNISAPDLAPTLALSLGLDFPACEGTAIREAFEKAAQSLSAGNLSKAPFVEPQEHDECFALGMELMERGRNAEALPYMERCLLDCPEHLQYSFWLSLCQARLGLYDAALYSAATLRDMLPEQGRNIRRKLALIAEAMLRPAEALELLGPAPSDLAEEEPVQSMRIRTMMDLERWNDAFDYLKALLLRRESPALWMAIADCYQHLGMYEEARLASEHVIADNPRLALAHANLSAALLKLGRDAQARAAMDEALRLGANMPSIRAKRDGLFHAPAQDSEASTLGDGKRPAPISILRELAMPSAEVPAYVRPDGKERERAAAILNAAPLSGPDWELRAWRMKAPERLVGAASWKLTQSGRTAKLFIRSRPALFASHEAKEMLRPLIEEIFSAGARSVIITEPEGRLKEEALQGFGIRQIHWSDEDWSFEPDSLRRHLATYDEVCAQALQEGCRLRPIADADWPIIERWALDGRFLGRAQFESVRKHIHPILSTVAEGPHGIGGILLCTARGMTATLEFICANPDQSARHPMTTMLLMRHLCKERGPGECFDSVSLNTNLNRSHSMHKLALRLGMTRQRERRHHLILLDELDEGQIRDMDESD